MFLITTLYQKLVESQASISVVSGRYRGEGTDLILTWVTPCSSHCSSSAQGKVWPTFCPSSLYLHFHGLYIALLWYLCCCKGEHGPMTSWLCSTGNFLHICIISGVARFLGRVITMAAHNMDFELKKIKIIYSISFYWLKNFNLLRAENEIVLFKIFIFSPILLPSELR